MWSTSAGKCIPGVEASITRMQGKNAKTLYERYRMVRKTLINNVIPSMQKAMVVDRSTGQYALPSGKNWDDIHKTVKDNLWQEAWYDRERTQQRARQSKKRKAGIQPSPPRPLNDPLPQPPLVENAGAFWEHHIIHNAFRIYMTAGAAAANEDGYSPIELLDAQLALDPSRHTPKQTAPEVPTNRRQQRESTNALSSIKNLEAKGDELSAVIKSALGAVQKLTMQGPAVQQDDVGARFDRLFKLHSIEEIPYVENI